MSGYGRNPRESGRRGSFGGRGANPDSFGRGRGSGQNDFSGRGANSGNTGRGRSSSRDDSSGPGANPGYTSRGRGFSQDDFSAQQGGRGQAGFRGGRGRGDSQSRRGSAEVTAKKKPPPKLPPGIDQRFWNHQPTILNEKGEQIPDPLGFLSGAGQGTRSPSEQLYLKENENVDGKHDSPLTKALMLGQQIARRPGYGKGDPRVFYTNYFELDTTNSKPIYRYKVDIQGFESLNSEEAEEANNNQVNPPTPSDQSGQSTSASASTQLATPIPPVSSSQAGTFNNPGSSTEHGTSVHAGTSVQPTLGTQPKPRRGLGRKLRRMFEILLKERTVQDAGNAVATDYAHIIYTAKKLDLNNEVSIQYHADDNDPAATSASEAHKVTFTPLSSLNVNDLREYLQSPFSSQHAAASEEIIQALNIIVKKTAAQNPKAIVAASNSIFYRPEGESCQLSHGLLTLKGYYACAKTSTSRLLINLNVRTSAFYKEGRVDVAVKELEGAKKDAIVFLKRRRVTTNYGDTTKFKIIHGFRADPDTGKDFDAISAKLTPCKDDVFNGVETVTVFDYYKRKYNLEIEEPHLPLLNLGPIKKKKTSNDTSEENVSSSNSAQQTGANPSIPEDTVIGYQLVPQQCCYIVPGQPYGKKLDVRETEKMKDFAARPPAENARRIVDAAEVVFNLTPGNSCLAGFGLLVHPRLITVYARRLDWPTVSYRPDDQGRLNIARLYPGSWNLSPHKLYTSGNNDVHWSYLQLGHKADLPWGSIIMKFHNHLVTSGLELPEPRQKNTGYHIDRQENDLEIDAPLRRVFNEAKKQEIKIMLVLLRDDNSFIYSRLKFISELEFGIHTVCTVVGKFREKWVQKAERSFASNLALKFNQKLGGENHKIEHNVSATPTLRNTMVMGIDVSHPSRTEIEDPKSIAGVVANTGDRDFSQWPCSLRTQKGRQEMVEELEDMVVERLNCWNLKTQGRWPEKMLIYRDGVADTQYDEVLKKELVRIKNACRLRVGKELPVTLVIVAKRHHTRFYPQKQVWTDKDTEIYHPRVAENREGNPIPGIIIDRGITMETGWDFYLQAHDCLQGTAKPAHYVVLHNGIDSLNASNLEIITHELSYLFGRATKAISICAPAYYAHVACERGKVYLHKYYHYPDRKPDPSAPAPKWDPATAPWTRTRRADVRNQAGNIVRHKDPLADQMFYI